MAALTEAIDEVANAAASMAAPTLYVPDEWWKPKEGCDPDSAVAKLQAKMRGLRSRKLYAPLIEAGKPWAPFVSTKMEVVRHMLRVGGACTSDRLLDLGSGEGRICLTAALEFGVGSATGIELDPKLVGKSEEAVAARGLSERVGFRCGDWFAEGAIPAETTMVTMFFCSHAAMGPALAARLRPGTRIVSYVYEVPGWTPTETVPSQPHMTENGTSPIYLYVLPDCAAAAAGGEGGEGGESEGLRGPRP